MKNLRKELDAMHKRLYDQFKYNYHCLPPLDIEDDKSDRLIKKDHTDLELSTNNDVIIVEAPKDLPPDGVFIKSALKPGQICYAAQNSIVGCPWVKTLIQKIVTTDKKVYDVTPVNEKTKAKQKVKSLTGRDLAYASPSPVKLPVGTRIIAVYTYTNIVSLNRQIFYAGIVAESPSALNNYRYLIFFDDGYAHYVDFKLVYPVVDSSKDVWDDIIGESKVFIKKYLTSYPDRPMVKFKRQQKVSTEYNGKGNTSTLQIKF